MVKYQFAWTQEAIAAFHGGDPIAVIAERHDVNEVLVSLTLAEHGVDYDGLKDLPGMSTKTRNGLLRLGYTRPRDLLQLSEESLWGVGGFGPKAVREVMMARRTVEEQTDDGVHSCEMCGDWDLVTLAGSLPSRYKACGHVSTEAAWTTFLSDARDTVGLVKTARAALAEQFGSAPEQWGVIYVKPVSS